MVVHNDLRGLQMPTATYNDGIRYPDDPVGDYETTSGGW